MKFLHHTKPYQKLYSSLPKSNTNSSPTKL